MCINSLLDVAESLLIKDGYLGVATLPPSELFGKYSIKYSIISVSFRPMYMSALPNSASSGRSCSSGGERCL